MAVSINNKNGTTTKVATNVKIVKQPANHFMTKAVYDPNGEVAQAGGIPEYVEGEIAESIGETHWVDTPFTKITTEQIYRYGAEGKVSTGLGAHWFASEPIAVHAGQRVKFSAAGNANTTSMISSSDENGNNLLVRALAIAKDGDSRPLVDYYYDVIDDGYIVVSGTSATYEPKLYIKNPNINEKTAFDIAEIKRSNVNNELCHIFKKVVCVGDSYTSGYMSDGVESLTYKPSYSWVEYMSELTGNEWINLGITGASTKSWLTDANGYQKAVAVGEAQAYVIGLAINDSNSSSGNYVPVGTSADIGTENDTYYGKLSKVITQLAVISPNAMFFVNTCPNWDLAIKERLPEYNQAIRDVCEHYKNTYKIHCIDLDADYHDLYNDPSYIQNYLGSHPTAIGHAQMAKMYEYVLSDYIFKHIQEFDSIPWTDYDETPKPEVVSNVKYSNDVSTETMWKNGTIDYKGQLISGNTRLRNSQYLDVTDKLIIHINDDDYEYGICLYSDIDTQIETEKFYFDANSNTNVQYVVYYQRDVTGAELLGAFPNLKYIKVVMRNVQSETTISPSDYDKITLNYQNDTYSLITYLDKASKRITESSGFIKIKNAINSLAAIWAKWNGRLAFGMDTSKANVPLEVDGQIYAEGTIIAHNGGTQATNRWSAHIFEGYSKDNYSRMTMLLDKHTSEVNGKPSLEYYYYTGSGHRAQDYGNTKIGSDAQYHSFFFNRDEFICVGLADFRFPITLWRVDPSGLNRNYSTVADLDAHVDAETQAGEHLSSLRYIYLKNAENGTMFYDTARNKVVCKINGAWCDLKYEDASSNYSYL